MKTPKNPRLKLTTALTMLAAACIVGNQALAVDYYFSNDTAGTHSMNNTANWSLSPSSQVTPAACPVPPTT